MTQTLQDFLKLGKLPVLMTLFSCRNSFHNTVNNGYDENHEDTGCQLLRLL